MADRIWRFKVSDIIYLMKERLAPSSSQGRQSDFSPPVSAEVYRKILREGRQRREQATSEYVLQKQRERQIEISTSYEVRPRLD